MATNSKLYKKKIEGTSKLYEKKNQEIADFVKGNKEIMSVIREGGVLEINIKKKCIEFFKGEDEGKKRLSRLEKISGEEFPCGCFSIIHDLMRHYRDTHKDYKASLRINYEM